MEEKKAKSKLTAILSADVKGYSRLMADDEETTVVAINAYREVMTGLIKDHRGRVLDAKGDNVLAEFSSVVDAVRCAVQIQKQLTDSNYELPKHRRMEFRIGINIGAPADRMTRDGTLWLDYPSVGGPSPSVDITTTGAIEYEYQHSLWIQNQEPAPWVSASTARGLESFVIKDLKPGRYHVHLYFCQPEPRRHPDQAAALQDIRIQSQNVVSDFCIFEEAGGAMKGIVKEFTEIEVRDDFTLELYAADGQTVISGIELRRQ